MDVCLSVSPMDSVRGRSESGVGEGIWGNGCHPREGGGVCTQEGRSQDTCCFVWPLDVPVGGREGVCVFLAGCGFVDVCVVVTCISM